MNECYRNGKERVIIGIMLLSHCTAKATHILPADSLTLANQHLENEKCETKTDVKQTGSLLSDNSVARRSKSSY